MYFQTHYFSGVLPLPNFSEPKNSAYNSKVKILDKIQLPCYGMILHLYCNLILIMIRKEQKKMRCSNHLMEIFSLNMTSTLLVDFFRGIHRSRSSYGWVRNARASWTPGVSWSAWGSWVGTSKTRRVGTGVNLAGWIPSTAFVGTSMVMVTRSSCIVWWVIHIVLVASSRSLVFNWDLTSKAVVYVRTTFVYAVTFFIVRTWWSHLKKVRFEAWWTSSGFGYKAWKNWIK